MRMITRVRAQDGGVAFDVRTFPFSGRKLDQGGRSAGSGVAYWRCADKGMGDHDADGRGWGMREIEVNRGR